MRQEKQGACGLQLLPPSRKSVSYESIKFSRLLYICFICVVLLLRICFIYPVLLCTCFTYLVRLGRGPFAPRTATAEYLVNRSLSTHPVVVRNLCSRADWTTRFTKKRIYYESIKRELKRRLIYEYRCNERLKTKTEESTRLSDTVPFFLKKNEFPLQNCELCSGSLQLINSSDLS
jgi:hypothetical protein